MKKIVNLSPLSSIQKILVVRRDNIGDLVCTTPIFRALRQHYPGAYICALVNSYNQPVLENNPDIDVVFCYTKGKHRTADTGILTVYWRKFQLARCLRRERFDYAIIASPGFLPRVVRFLRLIKPKHIIGFVEPGKRGAEHIDISIPYTLPRAMHEVEDIFRLLEPLGIKGSPPPLRLIANPAKALQAQQTLMGQQSLSRAMLLGIHISARKASQRLPLESVVALIRSLHDRDNNTMFMLFWSPGESDNRLHPGDDSKVREIMDQLSDMPVTTYPTHALSDLIGGLSLCDVVICSDGGAMHLAAGLGKPILCFFGRSDKVRWRPWGVPYELLQAPSLEVSDISVEEAMVGFGQLLNKLKTEANTISL